MFEAVEGAIPPASATLVYFIRDCRSREEVNFRASAVSLKWNSPIVSELSRPRCVAASSTTGLAICRNLVSSRWLHHISVKAHFILGTTHTLSIIIRQRGILIFWLIGSIHHTSVTPAHLRSPCRC